MTVPEPPRTPQPTRLWPLPPRAANFPNASNLVQEPVAQAVEHVTFNHGVAGSSPAGLTNKINDLAHKSDGRRMATKALVTSGVTKGVGPPRSYRARWWGFGL